MVKPKQKMARVQEVLKLWWDVQVIFGCMSWTFLVYPKFHFFLKQDADFLTLADSFSASLTNESPISAPPQKRKKKQKKLLGPSLGIGH